MVPRAVYCCERLPRAALETKVENEFIGSPCGQLDQIMIYFAKAGMGTHFDPKTKAITYVPLGDTPEAKQLRIVGLDTGTTRHGLESSTYSVRSKVRVVFGVALIACAVAHTYVRTYVAKRVLLLCVW